MKLEEINVKDIYAVCALGLCAFVFVLTSFIILSVNLPLGSDAYFHLQLSRLYAQGNFTGAFDFVQQVNKMPFYPPIYHLLIAPIASSPDPYTGLRILEMIFLPVTFALIAWLMWKVSGPKAALISGLVLIGSWSFMDGAIQARPESLDLLLYPLILWAALYTRKKWFAGLAIATVYNHGFAALTNIIGIAIKKLREKKSQTDVLQGGKTFTYPTHPWRKTMLISTAIITPIIVISLIYFTGAMQQWATYTPTENPQEALFWTYPPWIPFYAGITIMGFIFVFKKSQTELETLLKYGLAGNLIMLPFWADRWLQYSSIPLAMLTGLGVARWHGKKLYITLAVIGIGAWIYISNFILISLFAQWWQPGRFLGGGG